jgi:membrane dipeptidase
MSQGHGMIRAACRLLLFAIDFDGISDVRKGLEDALKMPALAAALLKQVYRDDDVRKLTGGNTLRVMREVIGR